MLLYSGFAFEALLEGKKGMDGKHLAQVVLVT
jgi:hypothetical protein